KVVLTHHGYKKALRGIAHKPQILREVIHETIAAGLWLKLESLYMTKSLANKLWLKDRLYTFCMKPDIDDEDKAVLLVISLPAFYKHFKEIMLYGNRETLSFDDVKSALLSKQKYDDDVEPESGEGLVARGRSSDRGKENNEKKPEKAADVAIAKGDSDGDVYLAIDTKKSKDELIVDFGCTFHMIPHRSWFTTYESFNGDLKRNLISLSTLKANGCKYSGEGGVMKIFKGALVLMKAIQSGSLYVLQGTVVYGTTGVATSKASLDDSKLWHYLLGHMGEKGMKNLPKKGKLLTRKYGIARHHTLVRTPHQNGVAERMNRTIMEKVRCMLSHANLDKDFWVEAATTATYLINHSPHRSLDGNILLWSCNSVDYLNLRVFGCLVYVHVNEGKLVPRAVKCIFLGYSSGVKGYRVWCPDPKYCKIIHSRDVTFNEYVIINYGKDFVPPHNVDNNHTEGKVEFEFDVENSTHTQPSFNDEHIETQDDGNMPTSPQSQPQTEYLLALDLERRQVNRPSRLEVKDGIPRVESNHYKARYVVCGFDQCEDIDFNKIYVEKPEDGSFLYLVLYVDDMLIYAPNKDQIRELKDQLSNEFDMKDLGAAKRILGVEIRRDREMEPHFKLSSHEFPKSEEDKEDMSRVSYSSAVGSLMYAMVCTRLDLAHAISVVSRYMNNPDKMHWEAVKCILCYLKGTSNIRLSFEKDRASPNGVIGYVDSDYTGDLDARKSLSSYIFSHCGSAISWYLSLQAITALSTTKTEYISSTEGVKEAIWLRGMVDEFGLPQEAYAYSTRTKNNRSRVKGWINARYKRIHVPNKEQGLNNAKKNNIVRGLLFQSIQIENLKTGKEMWEAIKTRNLGADRVKELSGIASKSATLGEAMSEHKLVKKFITSLPRGFVHIVATLEQVLDLKTTGFKDVVRRLKAMDYSKRNSDSSRGRGCGSYALGRGRGRGQERGQGNSQNQGQHDSSKNRENNQQKGKPKEQRDLSHIKCYLSDKFGDSIDAYAAKLSCIASKSATLEEAMSEHKLVKKFITSLPRGFVHIVATLEQVLDLKTTGFKDVVRRLKAMDYSKRNSDSSRGRGCGSYALGRGRGRGQERGQGNSQNQGQHDSSKNRENNQQKGKPKEQRDLSHIKCYLSDKFGRFVSKCLDKKRDYKANLSETHEGDANHEEGMFFLMNHIQEMIFMNEEKCTPPKNGSNTKEDDVWYFDNGVIRGVRMERMQKKGKMMKIQQKPHYGRYYGVTSDL
nr:retrovirus-related Pol polyprotein from transposon TNT 1-94 [Tanacetum cinerariifolium]